ncbi:TetR family transcriptional regulator [Subtercola boreus]|uniref:TetR family transcriptional regulator n=1 Tax=Subtercola boreus TaxID=120213 RepID=A0A3E0VGP6_9MICO|nr:TetR/AcrR family transcriptional regulator [Subtercola boreus]RFA09114.1 TetR family transcriptional regulator [Subtercola boreus]TQL53877.1 TetR family transcriptional regulator [Subtercola boreus]
MAARALRSDAQGNHDHILTVATGLFAERDADTSLKGVARAAGVGVGTVYRRFPTRDDLVEAVYRTETERLGAVADSLLQKNPPLVALRLWMDGFVQFMFTKQGMADALPAILGAHDGLRGHSRDVLRAAIGRLRAAAVADGTLRADVPADDIMLGLGGITLIAAHERDQALAARLLDLQLEGLRVR